MVAVRWAISFVSSVISTVIFVEVNVVVVSTGHCRQRFAIHSCGILKLFVVPRERTKLVDSSSLAKRLPAIVYSICCRPLCPPYFFLSSSPLSIHLSISLQVFG